MIPGARRWRVSALAAIFMISALYYLRKQQLAGPEWGHNGSTPFQPGRAPPLPGMEKPPPPADGKLHWHKLQERYPVSGLKPLPHGRMKDIPKIQAKAPVESAEAKEVRLQRRAAVKESFEHSWGGYKKHAWLRDEVTPISAQWRDTFGGWSATLVDSLDTLWIMGLKDDFELAVQASWTIDFSFTEQRDVNVFETTIRYMGGFLAAYDISEGKYPQLLYKAIEVGDLLMSCFDTPNRMPITRWDWKKYTEGNPQKAPERMLVSEIGSLSLEFTRLSQLTGDFKYYDAIQRVSDEFEKSQDTTQFPGMWPVSIDASKPSFDKDTMFTLGGMSDSLYEYFPKQYLLVGGLVEQPKKMYEKFINVAKKYMFFRILNPRNQELLVSGDIRVYQPGQPSYHGQAWELQPRGQHLTCFTGGMVGMAAKIFNRPDEIKIAEQLTEGCVWAYDSLPHGVAPEIFTVIPCGPDAAIGSCEWSQEKWYQAIAEKHVSVGDEEARKASVENVIKSHHLPPGFSMLDDKRYILRPEAIESVFYMLRITGDAKWADKAWRMFQAVERVGRTEIAASAIMDVTAEKVQKVDSMESFWLAETLKYFYLCFEEWDVVSLDEFVLNTEAHPLRRPGH